MEEDAEDFPALFCGGGASIPEENTTLDKAGFYHFLNVFLNYTVKLTQLKAMNI